MIPFLADFFRFCLVLSAFLLYPFTQSYAVDAPFRVNLIGCGAQMGQITGPHLLSGSGYLPLDKDPAYKSFRMTEDLGIADTRLLNADELTAGWTALPGGVIRVRVQHELQNYAKGYRTAEFKGFGGACEGQGNYVDQWIDGIRYKYHECIFNMPQGGTFLNVQYDITYEAPDATGSLICATPPAGDDGSGNPLPTDLDGNAFVIAVGDAAIDTLKSLGLKTLLQVIALNFGTAANDGSFSITVSAQDASTPSSLATGQAVTNPFVVIAHTTSPLDGGKTSNVLLKLKKSGRSFLKGKKRVRMYVAVKFHDTVSDQVYEAKTKLFYVRYQGL